MIVRIWKGICQQTMAESYIKHLHEDTLPKLKGINGFQEMEILKRETTSGVEFLVKTSWDSIKNIESFSGPEIDVAVVPQMVQEMMVSFDEFVAHYTIVYQ